MVIYYTIPRLDFRRTLGSSLRTSSLGGGGQEGEKESQALLPGGERGLISRTAAGNRAYTIPWAKNACKAKKHFNNISFKFVTENMFFSSKIWPARLNQLLFSKLDDYGFHVSSSDLTQLV